MADKIDNRKKYKPGAYVYLSGHGVAKVLGHENPKPRFDPLMAGVTPTPAKPDLLDGLNLPGLKKPDEPKNIPPFLRQSSTQAPAEAKYLRIAVIPEQREHTKHIFYVSYESPHLLDPFKREDYDRAIEECATPQEPRFDNLEDLITHAEALINSHDIVDVGRAYAYARGHTNAALRDITQQAIKIFLSHKGYFDFVLKNQTYDAQALRRTGKRMKLPKIFAESADGQTSRTIEMPITPLIGKEPIRSAVEEAVEAETHPVTNPADKPQTLEERQNSEFDSNIDEIADHLFKKDDIEQVRELAFLVAVLNNERADHLNFSQRLIILNELFGSKEDRPAVIKQIRDLSHSKSGRSFSAAKYQNAARAAFREVSNIIDNITENKEPLTVHEIAEEHPEAFHRVSDRIFDYK